MISYNITYLVTYEALEAKFGLLYSKLKTAAKIQLLGKSVLYFPFAKKDHSLKTLFRDPSFRGRVKRENFLSRMNSKSTKTSLQHL